MKRILNICILVIMLLFNICSVVAEDNLLPMRIGKVESFEYIDANQGEFNQVSQAVKVRLCGGENKGKVVVAQNVLTGNPYYDINLQNGMKVILQPEIADGNVIYTITDIKRSDILVALSVLFCALLIYVGKRKGLYSLVSIILTCALIYLILPPLVLNGFNAVVITFLICIFSTALTMYLVGGFNKKSTSATLGCILSIFVAGVLSCLTVKLAHLTGYTNETSMYLSAAHPELDLVTIIISAMLLATLGAVMDIAMSIASTINEIHIVDSSKTIKELFTCGMNVGRDIIGTMANTLILVYIGGSLPLLLLASNIDLFKFMNLNQVVTEIASALIGSSAIIICVPITALVASSLVSRLNKNFEAPLHSTFEDKNQ